MMRTLRHWYAAALLLQFVFFGDAVAQEWWDRPPRDDEQFIYGLGEDAEFAQAQQQALANIAGKLRTQLAASLERHTQDTGATYSDNISRHIRSETGLIELSQFHVLQSVQHNGKSRILLQLDRKRLASLWKQFIDESTAAIDSSLRSAPVRYLQQWFELRKLVPVAEKNRDLGYLLHALDGTQPGKDVVRPLRQVIATHKLKIQIDGTNAAINRALVGSLAQLGIGICDKNCDLQMQYQLNLTHDKLFGEYYSQLQFSSEVIERGQLLAAAQWKTQATSMESNVSSDSGAVQAVVTRIASHGIWNAAGFSEN